MEQPLEKQSLLLSRRSFIVLAGTSLASLVLPSLCMSDNGKRTGAGERRLSFFHIHTEESLDTVYRVGGEYRKDGLAAIDRILRDHRTGTAHAIDPALLDILFDLRRDVGGKGPYHVICGYRTPASNAYLSARSSGIGTKSLHMEGKAIDVRLPGVPLEKLRDTALALRAGGVGYYSRSNFIHVDTGRVRRW